MTADRMRACLTAIRWSQRQLARATNRDEGHVRKMARGASAIPPDLAAWLEIVAAVHEANPPPRRDAA